MSNEELVTEIQNGATGRMGELWGQVEKLVKWKANRIMTEIMVNDRQCGVEFDDLYNTGYIAMAEAVKTYKPSAGGFATWFMFYLQSAFSAVTGIRTQRVYNDPLNNYISLDKPLNEDKGGITLADTIIDTAGEAVLISIEDALWYKQLEAAVDRAIGNLAEKQREILRLRYWDNKTLEDISQQYGISRERVRVIEREAIHQLQQPRNAQILYPFWNFDYYSGTSLTSFRHSGQSVQERYLIFSEEFAERLRRLQNDRICKNLQPDLEKLSD